MGFLSIIIIRGKTNRKGWELIGDMWTAYVKLQKYKKESEEKFQEGRNREKEKEGLLAHSAGLTVGWKLFPLKVRPS